MSTRKESAPEHRPPGKPRALSTAPAKPLLAEVRALILDARRQVARTVNAGLTVLYWQIGVCIRTDILKEKRAEYGQGILQALAAQLVVEFGRGYSERNLSNMVRFAEVYPDARILQSLIAKLGWTHFQRIIYLDDALKRDFYAEMCRIENWDTRTLAKKIQSMLFERTALSRKPARLIQQELDALKAENRLTPDLVFRDPYVLDFLGLHDSYGEKDLEAAILREMEAFLLELGVGFCFVARQKRMQIGDSGVRHAEHLRRLPQRQLLALHARIEYRCDLLDQLAAQAHVGGESGHDTSLMVLFFVP